MSEPTPTLPSADRNLLFGILALQMNFVGRDALIRGMHAWVLDKDKPLAAILVEQGALSAAHRGLLEPLVEEHVRRHDGDPRRSLAALGGAGPVRRVLEQVADPEVRSSLAHVGADTPADPHATLPTAGERTAPGLRFRILRPHARGGLGEVYVASDEELHREVALKEIQEQYADDPHSRARFLLEAEVTGGLEHPGVVPVYGLGVHPDGRPYYAMRFIRGDSLKEAVGRFHQADLPSRDPGERALALRDLLRRFVDVCNAVAYAHSRGVLHRDLKPANVMLGGFGETLVVDWGLAKVAGRAEGEASEAALRPPSADSAAPTLPGKVVGTPQYMSPEQAEGRLDLLGPASDVYSLGATLYHLLAGQVAFPEGSLETILRKVQRGEFLPPRQVKRAVPAALEAVCLRAMALRPADRYPSAGELAREVERWLADEPVAAYPEPLALRCRRWARRHPAMVAGAVMLLVSGVVGLGLGLWAVSAEQQRTAEQRDRAEDLSERRRQALRLASLLAMDHCLTLCNQRTVNPEPSDDQVNHGLLWLGRALEIADKAEDTELQAAVRRQLTFWHRPLPAPQPLPCEHGGPVWAAAFRPDGRALVTGGELPPDKEKPEGPRGIARLWDLHALRPLGPPLAHGGVVGAVAFSPDGKAVATGSADGKARLWDAGTGRLLGTLPHPNPVSLAAFSPDGTLLATGGFDKTIRLWSCADGREVRTLTGHTDVVQCLAFSPDGRTIVTGSKDRTVRFWDTDSGRPAGEPLTRGGLILAAAFSPDGRVLLVRSMAPPKQPPNAEARLVEVGTRKDLGSLFSPYYPPLLAMGVNPGEQPLPVAFSPVGPFVAMGKDDWTDEAQLWDLVTRRPLGPTLRPATEGRQELTGPPVFSPDGRAILLTNRDRVPWVVRLPAAVEGETRRINLWVQVLTGMELDIDGVEHKLDGAVLEQRKRELQEMGGPPVSSPEAPR